MLSLLVFFFFNDTATTEIYTLSLHDALPILKSRPGRRIRPHEPRRARSAPLERDLDGDIVLRKSRQEPSLGLNARSASPQQDQPGDRRESRVTASARHASALEPPRAWGSPTPPAPAPFS